VSARIDVVWCDFGGVLTPPLGQAMGAIETATGIPWAVLATAADRVAARVGMRGLGPLELGAMSQAEWGALVEAELPAEVAVRHPLADFGTAWYAGRGAADPAVLDALARARARGARVGMLTNSVAEWEPLRRPMLAGASAVFESYLRSHEVGLAKPDPAIYRLGDRMLPPAVNAVLIDDLAVNIDAARDHGWEGILHTDAASTARALDALLH
jgi:putative hydrolase of the HAD superfamily